MIDFEEVRLELGYDYGVEGGPEFQTELIVTASGIEQRNVNWSVERGRWELGEREITQEKKDYLQDFFRARRGKAQGFRLRNWADWKVTQQPLYPDGKQTLQLTKQAVSGTQGYLKPVRKPVSGTVILYRNGIVQGAATVDHTTGIVTLAQLSGTTITGLTQANPGVMTIAAPDLFVTGDTVHLTEIVGMVQLNERAVTLAKLSANNYSIGLDTTGYSPYASGGLAKKYIAVGDLWSWDGEFDTPVRFDTDQFRCRFDAYASDSVAAYWLSSLPVVEVKT